MLIIFIFALVQCNPYCGPGVSSVLVIEKKNKMCQWNLFLRSFNKRIINNPKLTIDFNSLAFTLGISRLELESFCLISILTLFPADEKNRRTMLHNHIFTYLANWIWLPCKTWSVLDRIRTKLGRCGDSLFKWESSIHCVPLWFSDSD